MPYWVYVGLFTTVFQSIAMWFIHRTSKKIARDLRAILTHSPPKTLPDTDYRHALCPTCGQLITSRSAP